jgi:hypothetical protein
MAKVPVFAALTLFVLLAVCATHDVHGQSPTPAGKISIESNSIALAVGVNWGDGRLIFKGKHQLFAVNGLTLVDIGIAKASAIGDVYNLTDISQFEGTYLAGEAGFDLAGGIAMRNKNGVVLHMRGDSEEALLQLAPGGVTIKFRK